MCSSRLTPRAAAGGAGPAGGCQTAGAGGRTRRERGCSRSSGSARRAGLGRAACWLAARSCQRRHSNPAGQAVWRGARSCRLARLAPAHMAWCHVRAGAALLLALLLLLSCRARRVLCLLLLLVLVLRCRGWRDRRALALPLRRMGGALDPRSRRTDPGSVRCLLPALCLCQRAAGPITLAACCCARLPGLQCGHRHRRRRAGSEGGFRGRATWRGGSQSCWSSGRAVGRQRQQRAQGGALGACRGGGKGGLTAASWGRTTCLHMQALIDSARARLASHAVEQGAPSLRCGRLGARAPAGPRRPAPCETRWRMGH